MAQGTVSEPPFIARYRKCFDATWSDDTLIDQVRFVVLDTETTGLNPLTDRIITIGAVAVQNGDILLEDSFEALLRVTQNSSSVTVHGVTRDESRMGMEEPEALERFLEYLGDGVIVGHHIGHDIATFDEACNRHWGFRLQNRAVDTMNLALHFDKAGAFSDQPPIKRFTLDALCDAFGVIPHDRHTASGDAFMTALVFLRLRRFALKYGRADLLQFCEPFEQSEDDGE
jgi:DNA polymerase-3 subunit epsilon